MKNKIGFLLFLLLFIFIYSCKKKEKVNNTVTDIDGNIYNTVTIGAQTWMIGNLKVTHYNDGSPIPLVTEDNDWINLNTPGYCWYDNQETIYKSAYGALYNGYAVSTGKLCPKGWHVPSATEWNILENYLDSNVDTTAVLKYTGTDIGAMLKEIGTAHWPDPNYASNVSGFTAIPGGFRSPNFNGDFAYLSFIGEWWTSTERYSHYHSMRYLSYENPFIYCMNLSDNYGMSVRCIKD